MLESAPRTRPFSVTLLIGLVLMLIVWGATRLFTTLRVWDVLVEFQSNLSPWYLLGTGAGWVGAGGVLLWGMFTRKVWLRRALVASAVVWLIEYWAERGVFHASSNPNGLFAIGFSIVLLILVLVGTLHTSMKEFLMGSEEYEQQTKNSGPS